MPILTAEGSALVLIDFQGRLMPAIDQGPAILTEVTRLLTAARALSVPICATEQNPKGLGPTVESLDLSGISIFEKQSFDATRAPDLLDWLPQDRTAVVMGCETHVCVLQTVLGLLDAGRAVAVVQDACGSRSPANKAAGLSRMAQHGAEIVTAEMVLFEWLGGTEHPGFRDILKIIK